MLLTRNVCLIQFARKLHQTAIPRLGGLAFMPIQLCLLAIFLVVIYNFGLQKYFSNTISTWKIMPMFVVWGVGIVMLFIVGIADDLVHVHYKWKFFVQILAASLFPMAGLWINDLYGFLFIVGILFG